METPAPTPIIAPKTVNGIVIKQAVIAAFVTIVLAGMNVYTERARQHDVREAKLAIAVVADKTEDVQATLEEVTVATDDKLEVIHKLVNSSMGEQKRVKAAALRMLALNTGLPEDQKAANDAEREYLDHQAKQADADADAGTKTPQ